MLHAVGGVRFRELVETKEEEGSALKLDLSRGSDWMAWSNLVGRQLFDQMIVLVLVFAQVHGSGLLWPNQTSIQT